MELYAFKPLLSVCYKSVVSHLKCFLFKLVDEQFFTIDFFSEMCFVMKYPNKKDAMCYKLTIDNQLS